MTNRHPLSTTTVSLVAVFAGLIAASTLWPGAELAAGVPITLQTLAVLLCGAVLGPWRGAAAVVVYLVVGTAGAPIFAERSGGPAVWTGPTAGFLGGFVVTAFVAGWITRGLRRKGTLTTSGIVGACAVASLIVLNVIGWGFLALRLRLDWNATVALAAPFVIGDVIKVFVAGVTASAVHRAFPGLLGTKVAVKAPAVAQEQAAASAA